MAGIPNTEYITVKRDNKGHVGIFVGGKPATKYHGEKIWSTEYVLDSFGKIQKNVPAVSELHVLSSATSGKFAEIGVPSAKFGSKGWSRVKYTDGKVGPWVFMKPVGFEECVGDCVFDCVYYILQNPDFCATILSRKSDSTRQFLNPGVVAHHNAQNKR